MLGKSKTSGVEARQQFYFFFGPRPLILLRFRPQQRNDMTQLGLDSPLGCIMPTHYLLIIRSVHGLYAAVGQPNPKAF